MSSFPPTLILRHRKENLKKCSLRGLEGRADIQFLTYPIAHLPDLTDYFMLALGGEPLTEADSHLGLLLLDGTWRYVEKMAKVSFPSNPLPKRSLPAHFVTAYPRAQTGCADPLRGLASIEALYLAYVILGRDTTSLLDNYHWKERFLELNGHVLVG